MRIKKDKFRTTPRTIRNTGTISKITTTTMDTTIKIMEWIIPMMGALSTTITIIIIMNMLKILMRIITKTKIILRLIYLVIKPTPTRIEFFYFNQHCFYHIIFISILISIRMVNYYLL
jgi:hypothetical protein